MARIPYPNFSELPPELQQWSKAQTINIEQIHVFNMWAHSVSTVRPVITLGAAQYGGLELPTALRELVTLETALRCSADYEWVQHVPTSQANGITEEQREALLSPGKEIHRRAHVRTCVLSALCRGGLDIY